MQPQKYLNYWNATFSPKLNNMIIRIYTHCTKRLLIGKSGISNPNYRDDFDVPNVERSSSPDSIRDIVIYKLEGILAHDKVLGIQFLDYSLSPDIAQFPLPRENKLQLCVLLTAQQECDTLLKDSEWCPILDTPDMNPPEASTANRVLIFNTSHRFEQCKKAAVLARWNNSSVERICFRMISAMVAVLATQEKPCGYVMNRTTGPEKSLLREIRKEFNELNIGQGGDVRRSTENLIFGGWGETGGMKPDSAVEIQWQDVLKDDGTLRVDWVEE